MVAQPADYRWSSYAGNAQEADNHLLSGHPQRVASCKHNAEPQANYEELFLYQLDPELIEQIRSTANSNYTLKNQLFQDQNC